MKKYFIIKADDLRYIEFSKQWRRFLAICNEREIQAALGLIGESIDVQEQLNHEFLSMIENHEIFAHGYYHNRNEFMNNDLSLQINSILKTIQLGRKRLGKEIITFGAPYNKFNLITIAALNCLSIKIWLFGRKWNGKNVGVRNFEFEYSNRKLNVKNKYLKMIISRTRSSLNFSNLFSCRFDELVDRYEKVADQQLIVGQMHPNLWYAKDIAEFEKFVDYVLKKNNHEFIAPSNYFKEASLL